MLWLRTRITSERTRSRFDSQALENAGGDTLTLANEAEQQMLRAYVVVV